MVNIKNDTFEEWRPIPGWPEYEASSLGNIRTIERTVMIYRCDRAAGHARKLQGHLISQYISRGYSYAHIAGKAMSVSRLVAMTFLGPPPAPKCWVNHKNGDKVDNRARNLAWTTPHENLMHAHHALRKRIGESHWKAKLTYSQAWEVKRLIMQGFSDSAISSELGIKTCTIRAIRDGDNWRHVFFDGFVSKFGVRHAITTIAPAC